MSNLFFGGSWSLSICQRILQGIKISEGETVGGRYNTSACLDQCSATAFPLVCNGNSRH